MKSMAPRDGQEQAGIINDLVVSNHRQGPTESCGVRRSVSNPSARLPRSPKLSDPDHCVLYFIAGGGLIKIGISTNLTSRIRAIRNSSPVPLELLATMERASSALEGIVHSRFGELRRHGEWFVDDGSIRRYIKSMVALGKACLRTPGAAS